MWFIVHAKCELSANCDVGVKPVSGGNVTLSSDDHEF